MKTRAMHPVRNAVLLATAIAVFGCRAPLHEKTANISKNTNTTQMAVIKKDSGNMGIFRDTLHQNIDTAQPQRKNRKLSPEEQWLIINNNNVATSLLK